MTKREKLPKIVVGQEVAACQKLPYDKKCVVAKNCSRTKSGHLPKLS